MSLIRNPFLADLNIGLERQKASAVVELDDLLFLSEL